MELIIILLGLAISFQSFHLRRFIVSLIAFCLTIYYTFMFMAISSGFGLAYMGAMSRNSEAGGQIVFGIILAGLFAWLGWKFYRVFIAVEVFFSTIAFILFFFLILMKGSGFAVIIGFLIGLLLGRFAYKFADYAFILLTAFTGGLISALGFMALISSDSDGLVLLWTIVQAVLGARYQISKLNLSTGISSSGFSGSSYSGTRSFSFPKLSAGELLSKTARQIAAAFKTVFSSRTANILASHQSGMILPFLWLVIRPVFLCIVVKSDLMYTVFANQYVYSALYGTDNPLYILVSGVIIGILAAFCAKKQYASALIIVLMGFVEPLTSLIGYGSFYSGYYYEPGLIFILYCSVLFIMNIMDEKQSSTLLKSVVASLFLSILFALLGSELILYGEYQMHYSGSYLFIYVLPALITSVLISKIESPKMNAVFCRV